MSKTANGIRMTRQHRFYPWSRLMSLRPGTTNLELASSGGVEITEIDGITVVAPLLDNDTKRMTGNLMIPSHWDRQNKIRIYIVYSNAATTSGTVQFDLFDQVVSETGTIPASVPSVANYVGGTPPAARTVPANANSMDEFGPFIFPNDYLADTALLWKFAIQSVAGSIATARPIGIRVEFSPKFYKGRKSESPEYSQKRNN